MIILRNLADVIEDAQEHFHDRKVLYFPNKHICMSYPNELIETLVDEDETYTFINVPSFSNDMYASFFSTLDNELFEECTVIFNGPGKYRRIKDFLYLKNVLNDFYNYKNNYCKKIAKQYCINHHIDYDEKYIVE
jgi:hypothetical protein